jgi:hypothetical protein
MNKKRITSNTGSVYAPPPFFRIVSTLSDEKGDLLERQNQKNHLGGCVSSAVFPRGEVDLGCGCKD